MISLIVMQGYFTKKKKKKNEPRLSEHPLVVGGGKQTQNTREAWDTTQFLVVVFFTLTDRASTIPSNIRGCQSGTWSQRGTKVNGSHHGHNPLLGPAGIQIATKSYATLQAMAPTNNKTVHQTSFTLYREQPRSTRIDVAYVHGDLPRQHSFGTTLRFTGPVLADSRQ